MRENQDGEEYELLDNADVWSRSPHRHRMRTHYRDGNVIDWWQEESAERERAKEIHSKDGLRGLLAPLLEAAKMWFVIVATGIGVGVTGGWLDMLVKW